MITNEIHFIKYYIYGEEIFISYRKKPGMKKGCKVIHNGIVHKMDESFVEIIKEVPEIEVKMSERRGKVIKSQ